MGAAGAGGDDSELLAPFVLLELLVLLALLALLVLLVLLLLLVVVELLVEVSSPSKGDITLLKPLIPAQIGLSEPSPQKVDGFWRFMLSDGTGMNCTDMSHWEY